MAATIEHQQEPYICIWLGTPSECQNCGGWTRSEDEDGNRGPFPGDERFCSEECYTDHQEFVEREQRARANEWCPVCGFDRHEHAPDCASEKP